MGSLDISKLGLLNSPTSHIFKFLLKRTILLSTHPVVLWNQKSLPWPVCVTLEFRLSTIKLHEIKNACKTSLPYVNDWKRAYDPDVMVCVFLLFSSQTLPAPMNANMSIQLNPKIRDWDVIAFWLLSTNLIMIRNSMTYTTITVHLSIFNKWKVKNTFNPPWK